MNRMSKGSYLGGSSEEHTVNIPKRLTTSSERSERVSSKVIVSQDKGESFHLKLPANEGWIPVITVETSMPEVSFHFFITNGEHVEFPYLNASEIFQGYSDGRRIVHFQPEQNFYRDETGQSLLHGYVLAQSRLVSGDMDKKVRKALLEEPISMSITVLFSYIQVESGASQQKLDTKRIIEEFLIIKRHKRLKESSITTYHKNLSFFARFYPEMTESQDGILEYLARFDGPSGRTKRNRQDELNQLYTFASQKYGIKNPLTGLPRPEITGKPISVLTLEQVRRLLALDMPDRNRIILELMVGHGWRQVEVRRITGGDVRNIKNGLIWVHGKERDEWTPILPETADRLKTLSVGLEPADRVVKGRSRDELLEKGMRKMIDQLLARAGIEGITGHDLRRTFSTLVSETSGDEMLAMRLIRDRVPHLNSRYISVSPAALKGKLGRYSPLRLLKNDITKAGETPSKDGEIMVEAGESRTPRPEEATRNLLQAYSAI
jgi:integrase